MFDTKRLVAVLLVVLVVGSLAGVAAAQQGPFSDGTILVAQGETHTGDLQAIGGTVVIAGTVDGDVQATAGTVLVTDTGRITGSLQGVAGSVTLEGTVDGGVNVAAGALLVRQTADVAGPVEAAAGTIQFDGAAAGDVTLAAEELTVGPTARIGGTLEYDAQTASIAPGAAVAGDVIRNDDLVVTSPSVVGVPFQFGQFDEPLVPQWVVSAYWFVASLVLGAIVVLVAPGFARRVTGLGTKKTLRSGGVGLLVFVGVPVVLVLLLLTVVGIPLSLAGGAGFLLVLWVASVYGALVLGTWLLSLADYANRWAALGLGLALLAVTDFVPLGGVVDFLVLLVGLGAFALALRGESGDEGEGMRSPDEGPQEGSPMA